MKSKVKNPDIIIGIDPDCDRSGVAYLETGTKTLIPFNITFIQLIDYLRKVKRDSIAQNESVVVIVEAGWLNTISNYHNVTGRGCCRVAKNVGANHQVGKIIVEMARYYGFEVVEQKPFKKTWKGANGKITHDELAYFTNLEKKRTNQEERDAALIAWGYADFPIKLKV